MGRLTVSQRVAKMEQNAQIFVGPRMVRIMNEAAKTVRDYMVSRFMGGANTSSNRLARNTGRLEKSTVVRRATNSPDSAKASIVIGAKYASVHFGEGGKQSTTIRPKKGTALAIPLSAARGGDRRPVLAAGSPLITRKFTHNGILYGRLPGKLTQPLFKMAGSVTVPVRIHVERDIQPFAEETVKALIEREAQKLLG